MMRTRLLTTGMLLAALWIVPQPAAAQSGSAAAKGPDSKACSTRWRTPLAPSPTG